MAFLVLYSHDPLRGYETIKGCIRRLDGLEKEGLHMARFGYLDFWALAILRPYILLAESLFHVMLVQRPFVVEGIYETASWILR